MPRYNPFRPGSIVTPGMFSGRGDALLALERALFQTKHDNPKHFLLHGERGIGKSSLLLYLQYVANGDIAPIDGDKFSFLTVTVELEPTTTYVDLIRKIGAEFQRVVTSQQRIKELAKNAWEFLKRWEVMGVKYSNNRTNALEPHELLDDLVHTVHTTLQGIGEHTDGALILIDEASAPPPQAGLGEFAKLFTERLSKRGCNRVALGLAGLPELIDKLRDSHESSPRIFEMLPLEPLARSESIDVVRKGLAEIETKTGTKVAITAEAEAAISDFSEGYPHFIQQVAYSACEHDQDNNITIEDVQAGVFGGNGALRQLGVKYFHELYFEQIFSDQYRGVLRFMSEHFTNWVSKEDMRKALKIKETTLTNALTALRKRHIIISKDGHKGVYRLPMNSFAAWIRLYTTADAENGAGEGTRTPKAE
jgi:biotin operon repressor